MPLIISVSGIRGTIGGDSLNNLTPDNIIKFSAAFATMLIRKQSPRKIVLGRDGRISGPMVQNLVLSTLLAMGFDVLEMGLTTTPTIEMAVKAESAGGGIILTASHNPKEWNALKLLGSNGEFISMQEGHQLLEIIESNQITYAPIDQLGRHFIIGDYLDYHVEQILSCKFVDVDLIRQKKFKVVVDAINSSGAIAMPRLLDRLGVSYIILNQEVSGDFAHNPEPLPQHLTALCNSVKLERADLGIALDPDVDRLALVCEDGSWFGEEYTIVAAADLVLRHRPGPVVSNLSSSKALGDLAERYGQSFSQSAVGEVHVVEMMKTVNAVIGGEGNGGVILPDLHYGRDALIGVAMILTLLAEENLSLSGLRKTYPDYYMAKYKVNMQSQEDWTRILKLIRTEYRDFTQSEVDGLKVSFADGWFHLRKSNTEPIIRIYTEKPTQEEADTLAGLIQAKIEAVLSNTKSTNL